VLALVFEHRWAQPILGFRSNGTIVAWLPLFLFVVLFGLSMDYHVFILSHVREAVDRGQSTDAAVGHSIGTTAGVVSAAAFVMVCVFALLARSQAGRRRTRGRRSARRDDHPWRPVARVDDAARRAQLVSAGVAPTAPAPRHGSSCPGRTRQQPAGGGRLRAGIMAALIPGTRG
jgi:hypothetical protein